MISDLSDDLTQFLRDYVSGYDELEALLLLARSNSQPWAAERIAESLNVSVDSVASALESLLAGGGLIETVDPTLRTFRYAPASEEIRELVTRLQRAYVEQLMAVVQVMTTNAIDRVRSSAARRLAEAFRFQRSRK